MSESEEFEFEAASQLAASFLASVFVPLTAVAEQHLLPGQTVGDFLHVLITKGLYLDALRLMAHALPTRRALWWGCVCILEHCDSKTMSQPERTALRAVTMYVLEPTDTNRSAAEVAGNRVPFDKPLYQLARSAGYRSLPLPAPKFSKRQDFPARGVFGALWLALGLAEADNPELGDEQWLQFLALGLDISRGAHLWPEKT